MPEWFRDFFDQLYGEVFFGALDHATIELAGATLADLLGLSNGDHVLDVPCGNGRLSFPLAANGVRVTGVDLCLPYLDLARSRAAQDRLDAAFVCCDMRALPFDGAFDATFNWGGSFGYFDEADNARFCDCLFHAVRPGARVLIETVHRAWLLANFQSRNELVLAGTRVRQDHRFDEPTSRLQSTWTYRRGAETRQHELSIRVYDTAELSELLCSAGFCDIEFHGGPPPVGPLRAQSRRVVTVATRPR